MGDTTNRMLIKSPRQNHCALSILRNIFLSRTYYPFIFIEPLAKLCKTDLNEIFLSGPWPEENGSLPAPQVFTKQQESILMIAFHFLYDSIVPASRPEGYDLRWLS
jgi:hypothetical protein